MPIEYKKAASFFWFNDDSLAEWQEYLNDGADRAEVHKHGNHMQVSFFRAGEHLGTVNESHLCPIDCP